MPFAMVTEIPFRWLMRKTSNKTHKTPQVLHIQSRSMYDCEVWNNSNKTCSWMTEEKRIFILRKIKFSCGRWQWRGTWTWTLNVLFLGVKKEKLNINTMFRKGVINTYNVFSITQYFFLKCCSIVLFRIY